MAVFWVFLGSRDLGNLLPLLGMEGHELPLLWTAGEGAGHVCAEQTVTCQLEREGRVSTEDRVTCVFVYRGGMRLTCCTTQRSPHFAWSVCVCAASHVVCVW